MSRYFISFIFVSFIVSFLGLCIKLFGGSFGVMSVGVVLSLLVFIALFSTLTYKVIKKSKPLHSIFSMAFIFSFMVSIFGLCYSYYEGMIKHYSGVGFKIFFVGLGLCIIMLIAVIFYILIFTKDKDFK